MGLSSISILEVVNKDIKVIDQEQNIFDTSKVMIDNNIGSVVIIDNNDSKNPVGIVTERDIVRIVSTFSLADLEVPVRELMSYPLITLSQNASVLDAMKLMYERKIRRIIVLEGNNLVGIVTEHDIFKLLMSNKELISTVISSDFPIPQKDIYEDFSRFWFSNSFYK
ncbi:CBS domain-containing protein [Candidatus Nitrosocosmicus agrestis]|jgi:CBS domain-containing protein|uniref:CBS domain-containing protein n=2 Tax=Candidatus Nitrosocosmicus agrestis TaxID=2563600 RepID=UPI00122E6EC2|nr:CBS domain-containing protein [Candidatus Nitrosocosmicus sp. SS]KAA2281398.1 CBS domain-containing protein [Candidatus Nitrosocosmicus sp. SS]MDR4491688.1 CBS domain-containing protein [Candidatus Nitrosocosmicus sp.]